MASREPIAITGIGCRFPGGADGPEAFWKLLRAGVDAITEVPADRWNAEAFYDSQPGRPGKSITRSGGFLDSIDRFDAGFFGISPREAAFMDPQHRLLLQAAWEALDDGGEVIDAGRRASVGVFVGISTGDYGSLQIAPPDQTAIDVWTATGGEASIAANRISYCLNLAGPSLAVDTACSSSLVAVHLACASLWNGECALALVGGVNALLFPVPFITLSHMLSPDGRCRAFDAAASGFVRAEGVGVVALKPLGAALAAGNPIYAVIRGTAVNQDGRTSSITVPSVAAQTALVRDACRSAGVRPADVQYLEAHGTGTLVGDPIEAEALGAALGTAPEREHPLWVGSVKTNIGHLEAGAGIAGLIKVALSLSHGEIPPSLHFHTPNPQIDFARLGLAVAQAPQEYRAGTEPPIAGVNSFGFGGTNAHTIVQAPPAAPRARPDRSPAGDRAHVLVLSARSAESLRALVERYRDFLGPDGAARAVPLGDVCFTAGAHRTAHRHRLAVAGDSREDVAEKLAAHLAGESRPGLATGMPVARAPVFVYSGQGPQWWAMGRELLHEEPVFREQIEACDRLFRSLGDWSLLEEMAREEASSRLSATAIAQPAIFALQVALTALWRAWGVRPAAVVGHSVGEVAAAHCAGVLSLADAARVIFHRGRCMDLAPERGRMLAVGLSWEQAEEAIAGHADLVSIAALNGPQSVTLSGDAAALDTIAAALERRQVFCRFLPVNYAFHSAQMDPVRDELLRALGQVDTAPATLPVMSTVTGAAATSAAFRGEYWWRNVRLPVRFATAIDALAGEGQRVFLEVGPHPVLGASIMECLASRGVTGRVLGSLRRKEPERVTMLGQLGALYTLGVEVDWRALEPDARVVRLPAYTWQTDRFWHEDPEWSAVRAGSVAHPLLARPVRTTDPTWQTRLGPSEMSYLRDHRAQERLVFPAAGYVEMAVGAVRALSGSVRCVIEDLELPRALVFPEGDADPVVQLRHGSQDGSFSIASSADRQTWRIHAEGTVRAATATRPGRTALDLLRARAGEEVSPAAFYGRLHEIGLAYGPAFRVVEAVWSGPAEAVGRVGLAPDLADRAGRYVFHPALLDGCFQIVAAALPAGDERSTLYLPSRIDRVRVFGPPADGSVWCHVRLVRHGARTIAADILILDAEGNTLVEITGFTAQAVVQARTGPLATAGDCLYGLRWIPRPLRPARRSGDFLAPVADVVADVRALARGLVDGRGGAGALAELDAALDGLGRRYVVESLDRMGWRVLVGEPGVADGLARRLGLDASGAADLDRYLARLEADGVLRRAADAWTVADVPAPDSADAMARGILARFPAALPELSLLRHCGVGLAASLRGQAGGRAWLATDDAHATVEHYEQDSPSRRNANRLVAEAVTSALSARPRARTVRVLELGAGTGGVAAHVLPRLDREHTEYVFSDPDEAVLNRAEAKLFEYPFVRRQVLDPEAPLANHDVEARSFDVVLAGGAFHATGELPGALARARELLVPGGILILCETLRAGWLDDLVWGSAPRRDAADWRRALGEAGLTDVAIVEDEAVMPRRALVLAREPIGATREATGGGEPRPELPGPWLVVADRTGVGEGLAATLSAAGARVVTVLAGPRYQRLEDGRFEVDPASPDGMQKVLGEVHRPGAPPLAGVVHLWGLDARAPDEGGPASLAAAEVVGCHGLVHLLQALHAAPEAPRPRLWVITRGSQAAAPGDPVNVSQAPLWGLGRVLVNELPGLACRLVDLAPEPAPDEVAALVDELTAPDVEEEVAHRDGARYALRLVPASLDALAPRAGVERPSACRLETTAAGALDRLVLRPRARRAPGSGEVEIAVEAAALNFRDVLKALGIYPTEDDDDLLLGDECAGRIAAVGPDVEGWRVGDEALAIAPGSFGSHVLAPVSQVVPLPDGLSFDAAATIPVAFLTAWYSLHHVGRIRPGEQVLIQAATGGVGLAALQIAQRAGAVVLATAGSVEKRELLRALGVRHVMDSRSLAFADEVRALTGGRGVDLVLNSLAGEAIAKGIGCLAPRGRFLEIGKRDIYQNTRLPLRPLRHNISLSVIDLAQVLREDPALVAALLAELRRRFADGTLHPLPYRVFPLSQAAAAFRHMSQARHVGKVVLSPAHDRVTPVAEPGAGAFQARADATYLIAGGLGGFGLALAEWLIEAGARHLVLTGRTGAATEAARQAVAALQARGAEVVVAAADVASTEEVARVFRDIARTMPPLRGIVHAAMVIEDRTVLQQDGECFHRVMAPKCEGAWNLHAQAIGLPLDFFVLCSSVSGLLGSPGQASYAAANTFLDALAHHRRQRGLPALAVNWGVLGGVGYVARNARLAEFLEGQGHTALRREEATAVLGRLLTADATQVGVARIDWAGLADSLPGAGTSPRYAGVRSTMGEAAPGDAVASRAAILRLPPGARLPALTAGLTDQIARVLRTSAASLDPQNPLSSLGLDSLMSQELASRIETYFEVTLPAGRIKADASVASLAAEVLALVTGTPASAAGPPGPPASPLPPPVVDDRSPARPVPPAAAHPVPAGVGAPAADADELDAVPPVAAEPGITPGVAPAPPLGSGERIPVRFYAEWMAARAARAYLRRGDHASASRRVRRLARLAPGVLRSDWRWALLNLRLVFGPNLTDAERRALARLAFDHHLSSYMEGLRHAEVDLDYHHPERLFNAHAVGRGVILCGVHLGSWEAGLGRGAAASLPMAVVYRRAHNPLTDRLFQDVRASYPGVQWILSSDVDAVTGALRAGKVVALMTDLNTLSGGTVADFLGVPATCPSGPARLALLLGAPIVPAVAIRSAPGKASVHFEPVILPPDGAPVDGQVPRLTGRINAAFEPWILEYAEQYNWLHPRWRMRPDGRTLGLESGDALVRERTSPFLAVSERVRRLLRGA